MQGQKYLLCIEVYCHNHRTHSEKWRLLLQVILLNKIGMNIVGIAMKEQQVYTRNFLLTIDIAVVKSPWATVLVTFQCYHS